ncbi:hypothetical protein QJQ45_025788, partial [Haematococcus lacustris]
WVLQKASHSSPAAQPSDLVPDVAAGEASPAPASARGVPEGDGGGGGMWSGLTSASSGGPSLPLASELEGMRAALRIKAGEVRALELTRDRLAEELVAAAQTSDQAREVLHTVAALKLEVEEVRARYVAAVELLGERDEALEELRADLLDVRNMYKEQLEFMLTQLTAGGQGGRQTAELQGVQEVRTTCGMSFFANLFRGKSAGGERLSASKLTRAVARPSKADPDDSDGDDDSIGPLSAPVPGIHRRTACDISQSTVRSDLRRSQSAREPGTHSGLLATPRERCSTSSSEGTPDEPLRVYYKSVKQCHRGKKAIVSEAVDKTSKRPVIIKAFLKQGMTQVKREKMLRENAMLKAANGVPGVVRLLNVLDDTQYEYHVLEYVPGESASCTYNICHTLIEVMANNGGRLSESRCVLEVVLPLLRVLAGLHSLGIVHRDIKPEHIMCSHGNVKLLDFCEAAQQSSRCLNYRTGQLEYIAPEVLSKPRAEDIFHEVLFNGMSEEELPQYNEKADIWSTGVVIYEALTGLQPFPAETAKELAEMQACKLGGGECSGGDKGSFPAFIQDTRLTAHAQSFLNSMLQADPAQRSSAEQLLQHPWVVKHATSQHSQWLLSPASAPALPQPQFPAKHPIIPPAGQTMQLRASPLVITGPMHVPVR